MGSVFDYPDDVDLNLAVGAERLLRAAGLSRSAAIALIAADLTTLDEVRVAAWLDASGVPGLHARLCQSKFGGPAIAAEIERWRGISAGN